MENQNNLSSKTFEREREKFLFLKIYEIQLFSNDFGFRKKLTFSHQDQTVCTNLSNRKLVRERKLIF